MAQYLFPYDGDYQFTITGRDPHLTVDGLPLSLNGGFAHVKAGLHQLGLTAAAHSFAEPEGDLQSFIPGRAFPGYGFPPGGAGPGGRRAPSGPSIEIIGPFHPTGKPVQTESRARIFVCHPPDESEEASCAARIFSNIAQRAFRRPVTAKDLVAPMDFFKEGRENSGTFRRRNRERHYRDHRQPQVSLSGRAAAGRSGAGNQLSHQRSGTGVAPFFLPVEHRSRRRTALDRRTGQAEGPEDFRAAGTAHAGEPAIAVAGNEFRLRMAAAAGSRYHRSRSVYLSELRPQPARGIPDANWNYSSIASSARIAAFWIC